VVECEWMLLPPYQGRRITGAEVPFHDSIISNFMVFEDRLETNLLQYSRTQKIQNVFYVIIFEVNIVDEQKQT